MKKLSEMSDSVLIALLLEVEDYNTDGTIGSRFEDFSLNFRREQNLHIAGNTLYTICGTEIYRESALRWWKGKKV